VHCDDTALAARGECSDSDRVSGSREGLEQDGGLYKGLYKGLCKVFVRDSRWNGDGVDEARLGGDYLSRSEMEGV
jgi:hypothetical protein